MGSVMSSLPVNVSRLRAICCHHLRKDGPVRTRQPYQPWSLESAGMLQWAYWVAFAEEGIGASLQHYNELIEEEVRKMYNVRPTWNMLAQMPFGIPYEEPEDKDVMPVEERAFYYPAEVSDGK